MTKISARKSYFGLLAVTMTASFITPFMGSAVNVALPKIGSNLNIMADGLSWVAMSYILSSAVLLLPFGALSDIVGRKKIFITGMIIFSVSSILCAISTTATMLFGFRILQGIGAAMVFGTSMAMVTAAVPPKRRGAAIGTVVFATYTGLSVAPVLGGIITHAWGWRSIFWLTFVVCTLVSIMALYWIRDDSDKRNKPKFDYKGSIIYGISLSLFMYGLSKITETLAICLLIVGFIGMIVFILFERKIETPVLNVKLFATNRIFAFSNLAALINYAATFALSFMLSLYLQYAKGMNPAEAGSILIAQPVIMALVAPIAGRLSDKYQARWLSSIGMMIIVVGLIPFIFLNINTSISLIITSLLVLGIGFGVFSSPNTNAVMSSVNKQLYGVASASLGTMRLTGQMLSMGVASLAVHIFIGNEQIRLENIHCFLNANKMVFIIFSILCFLGIFASLARGNEVQKLN